MLTSVMYRFTEYWQSEHNDKASDDDKETTNRIRMLTGGFDEVISQRPCEYALAEVEQISFQTAADDVNVFNRTLPQNDTTAFRIATRLG